MKLARLIALTVLACLPAFAGAGDISRGAYLARAGDCTACHTAGPNAAPFAGGLHMNSPLGTIISTNITPDPETGIGRYTLAQFSDALRRGIRGDGKRLYPAMPFASFAALTDADVADLFSFFKNEVAAVRYRPPPTSLPFPFNQRWGLAMWDGMFVQTKPFAPRADRSATWNRGAYLVQTLGHCGACHTPRGLLFQERGYDEASALYLAGSELDHWYAPDLGGNPASGMGRRSVDDLVSLLRTGHGAGASVYGPMVDVVTQSTSKLTETDLTAMATYLKTLPARASSATFRPIAAPVRAAALVLEERPGAAIYSGFCKRCHGANGEGNPPKHPRLAGSPTVLAPNGASLLRIVLEGSNSPSIVHAPMPDEMPAFDARLSDADIADVLTLIRNSWGNHAPPISRRDAAHLRAKLADDASLRRARDARAGAGKPPAKSR